MSEPGKIPRGDSERERWGVSSRGMSAVVNPLEIRILMLERRIADLERRLDVHAKTSRSGIEPVTLAIIAAAVAASGYGRIKYATRVFHASPVKWAHFGRQEHFYSHRIR